ncbi:MAG: hypothetical protein HC817_14265 [Saprospiraceae bacterium]|nr:hypothetical protein [Saprospiraceae bacterium]
MFISEKTIDQVIGQLETSDFEREIEQFGKAQPALMSYIFSEDFELMTQEERELLLYMMLVVWQAVEKTMGEKIHPLSKMALESAEEANWELLDGVTEKRFRERMTVFFENSAQEDLLAFVEDTLTEDEEDSIVTKEGREPMFVAMKTVIDVLTN